MTHTAQHPSDDILGQILRRSATNKEFRGRLLTNPDGAIEHVLGVSLSSLATRMRARFVEKEPGVDALIVLPDFAEPRDRISVAALESVAEGNWCLTSCTFSLFIPLPEDPDTPCHA